MKTYPFKNLWASCQRLPKADLRIHFCLLGNALHTTLGAEVHKLSISTIANVVPSVSYRTLGLKKKNQHVGRKGRTAGWDINPDVSVRSGCTASLLVVSTAAIHLLWRQYFKAVVMRLPNPLCNVKVLQSMKTQTSKASTLRKRKLCYALRGTTKVLCRR